MMMEKTKIEQTYQHIEFLRNLAMLFSSQTCERVLRFGHPTDIKKVFQSSEELADQYNSMTAWQCLDKAYSILRKHYRNEYVYKNEFLTQILIRHYGLQSTIAINEFRVGKSIADLALFNGETKAFEIKSERDSRQRLSGQLNDYILLFDKCYIVVPSHLYDNYRQVVDDSIGIITLCHNSNGSLGMRQMRKAEQNNDFSLDIMMRSIRREEYKNMVIMAYGSLPDVNEFDLYEACFERLSKLSSSQLRYLFRTVIKRRSNFTRILPMMSKSVRQMCLSLNVSKAQLTRLDYIYSQPIFL